MAKVYAELIRKGLKSIDDVPDKIKSDVQALLGGEEVESNGNSGDSIAN